MNENIKEKLKKGVACSAILLSVATIGIIGGNTYSKYFTQIEGKGSATVAQWSFKANNQTNTIANIKLSNTYSQSNIKQNTIAPGTSGQFDIVLDATGSDVAINYEIKFKNSKNKPTNLKFTYGTKTSETLEGLEDILKGTINLEDNRTKTITIKWNWAYETGSTADERTNNDKIDTNDAGKDYSFDIEITGTQVNPGVQV